MRSTRPCSTSSAISSRRWPPTTMSASSCCAAPASISAPAPTCRRAGRAASRSRSRRNTSLRDVLVGARRPAEADHRGRARRRDRRRRRLRRPAATWRSPADAAFFSIPEVRVGMSPMGIMPFMIRAIGPSRVPPLRVVGRADPGRGRAAARPRARALRADGARRHADADRRRAAARRAACNQRAQGRRRALCVAQSRRDPRAACRRRTIRNRRRRRKASRPSARSASRAGIRNELSPRHARHAGHPRLDNCMQGSLDGRASPP